MKEGVDHIVCCKVLPLNLKVMFTERKVVITKQKWEKKTHQKMNAVFFPKPE
jgi:hypothetical protein